MNTWPYTDFHDLNLDWLLSEMMKLREEWEEFKAQYPPATASVSDNTAEVPEDITEPVEVELAPND